MARSTASAPRKDEKTGTWFFVVDVGVRADGRRRQAYRRGFPTKKAAQEELDKLRHSASTSTYVAPKRQRLAEYLSEDWLPAIRHKLARSTWESYERNIRNHVSPALGSLQLQQIDGATLNRFYADLLESGRIRGTQSPGLKPRTVRYLHTILHSAFDDAIRWRRLVVNPAAQATPPSATQAKSPEMRVWTQEQVLRFLELCEGDRYYWPWLFLVTTGCRRGEALGLRWSDVDFKRRVASIRQELIPLTKTSGRGREGFILPRTKSGKPRVINLDSETLSALRTWKARQSEEHLLVGQGYKEHDLVFCRPDGRPYHPEAFSKAFDRRLRQERFAELPLIRLHDLRHTWATLALVAGINVKVVSERLGHSSSSITSEIYQHVAPGMQAEAAELVSAMIFGSKKRPRFRTEDKS